MSIHGTFVFDDGSRYGRIHCGHSLAEGEWKETESGNVRDGKGIYANGHESYEGEWRDDAMHGKGTYNFASGARYEGEFEEDEFSGYGVYTWHDGARYDGHWSQNQMHGTGKYTDGDGVEWNGEFYRGRFLQGRALVDVRPVEKA